jgi:hypothetical protein
MTSAQNTILLCIMTVVFVTGCAVRKPPEDVNAFVDKSFVDLEPGWRVRVVTPILSSGKFKPQSEQFGGNGKTGVLQVGSNFLGYETDYYTVSAQDENGVAIRFETAEITNDGKSTRRSQPMVPLFDLPENVRYVRLLFLTRASETEHDQAILGSSSSADLDLLKRNVEDNPAQNCKIQPQGVCTWVPSGIAVQPEKKADTRGKAWIPAT